MNEDYTELERKLSLGKDVRVLKSHPCGLIALEKPTGIRSHPNEDGDTSRCLVRGEYDFDKRCFTKLQDRGCLEEIYLIHRLDSATSGVILVCINEDVALKVRRSFEKSKVQKQYHAIVRGKPRPFPRVWKDFLEVRGKGKGPLRVTAGSGNYAETQHVFRRADANGMGLSLLELMPVTGRTHQLRAQCAIRKCPIVGDRVYGDFAFNQLLKALPNARRMFLHSSSIEVQFYLSDDGIVFRAESPLPLAFDQLLKHSNETRRALKPSAADIHRMQMKRLGGPRQVRRSPPRK